MKNLIYFIKGLVVGATTSVPGVSGGTMAIILDIYDKMIHSISKFFKDKKNNFVFLLIVGTGMIIGLFGAAPFVDYMIDNFRYPSLYFFLGVVFGGMPVLIGKANKGKKKKTDIIFFLIGALMIGLLLILEGNYEGELFDISKNLGMLDLLILFISGIIIAIALILPGISTSFLLITLGLYKPLILAVKDLNFIFLIPIVLGVIFGTIATTSILEKMMNEKPRQTYLLIIGFVVISIVKVFPGIPTGWNILFSILSFILGYLLILFTIKKVNDVKSK